MFYITWYTRWLLAVNRAGLCASAWEVRGASVAGMYCTRARDEVGNRDRTCMLCTTTSTPSMISTWTCSLTMSYWNCAATPYARYLPRPRVSSGRRTTCGADCSTPMNGRATLSTMGPILCAWAARHCERPMSPDPRLARPLGDRLPRFPGRHPVPVPPAAPCAQPAV